MTYPLKALDEPVHGPDAKFVVNLNVCMASWSIISESGSYTPCDMKLLAITTRLFDDASPH